VTGERNKSAQGIETLTASVTLMIATFNLAPIAEKGVIVILRAAAVLLISLNTYLLQGYSKL
jgi:hypothetical protein